MWARLLDSTDPRQELHLALFAGVVVAFLSFTGIDVLRSGHFAMRDFGEAIGFIFAGGGCAAVGQGAQRKLQGAPTEGQQS